MLSVEELNDRLIDLAFSEDIGDGDHTTLCCIPEDAMGESKLLIKEAGIFAGVEIAKKVFHRFDPTLQVEVYIQDGAAVKPGDIVMSVRGKEQSLLQTERLMLNILQRMSGIATMTHRYQQALIDAGTKIDSLDKIVAGITDKPVTLIATHVHPDHTGSAIHDFPEIWINAADTVNVPEFMAGYKGEIKYLEDGQVFDLGDRQIEVIFTPGHTPGSASFFELGGRRDWGYSGDAFGSGNLLLTTNFSTLLATTTRIERYMHRHGISKMYPGHYMGSNPETLQRISDLRTLSDEMIEGVRKGETGGQAMMGLNGRIRDFGVNVSYRDPMGLK